MTHYTFDQTSRFLWKRVRDIGKLPISRIFLCTNRVDWGFWNNLKSVLLRICGKPQLTSLPGFQGPTTTHSVRQKKHKEPTCSCSFAPIVILFCSACAPHHTWRSCLVFRSVRSRLRSLLVKLHVHIQKQTLSTCMHACMHTYIHTYIHIFRLCISYPYTHLSPFSYFSLSHTHRITFMTKQVGAVQKWVTPCATWVES
jgi:hypothetical protein